LALSYKDSGVDIKKGDELVEKIKSKVKKTYGTRVCEGVGGFASLYRISPGKLLAAGTDGVGTKVKIAQHLGVHHTIGLDLVAMCVNDILCTGATPLFFMDYLATGKLDVNVLEKVVEGVVKGCEISGCGLIGGETAEMPGVYEDGVYDLAGFAVGEVQEDKLIDGQSLKEGDILFGLPSTGVHSNGLSLVRKLIYPEEKEILASALKPTRIYSPVILELLRDNPSLIKGMAHITGGGMSNIARINKHFDYQLDQLPGLENIPEIFSLLKKRSNANWSELYRTFNMGVGFVLITSDSQALSSALDNLGEKYWIIGKTLKGKGRVYLNQFELML
jgi:phosphoribosylformylglycinamidine cyclo-ligase